MFNHDIGLIIGGVMFVIETIVVLVMIHHLKKMNEHTKKLDGHLEQLNVCYDQLHEHSHSLEKNVERICSCVLPERKADDETKAKAEAEAEGVSGT